MTSYAPDMRETIAALPTVGVQESVGKFDTVKTFLARFGYLERPPHAGEPGADDLDDGTSLALATYQSRHALPATGVFDEPTREMMSRPRCGFPDVIGSEVASAVTCTWNRDALSYAFAAGTGDVAGDVERDAVRRAFATWSAATQLTFREVGTGDGPDIRIAWTQAHCGDANMTGGVLAHADYPPGCGFYGNALPRPLHFDDQENTWRDGAAAGQFDVETVAMHEIGHLLGLAHSTVPGTVMWPSIAANSIVRVLAPDDVEGIRRLYPIRGPVFVRHSGLCLDIAGGSTANGAEATQWEYWGGQNQVFRVEWVEAGHYRLIATHSGRVVDVRNVATGNGAQIHQWDWWGGGNQKFRLDPVGHGYYRVVAQHSGRVLDVSAGSANNGARILQWDWWGGGNQQWRLGPASIVARHSGKALDVSGISVANGARIIQWPYWGGGNQRFRLDPVGEGFYRIVVENSGKCLDVAGLSTANGAQIIQWDWWGGDNQRFKPEPTGAGYYRMRAKHSGKVLDVAGISTANGAQIIQWDWLGGNNQQWRL